MAEYVEKRKHVRYSCDVGAEVLTENAKSGYWGTVADISLVGCYVNTFSPLPAGTNVTLRIKTNQSELTLAGNVVTSHPGVGMGIQFVGYGSANDEVGLKSLVGLLAKGA